jgi:hypothetical protein
MSVSPSSQKEPSRLMDRYDFLEELLNASGGRFFRARDLAFAETVGIKQFNVRSGPTQEGLRQLEETVRYLQCLPHPNLVRLYALDTVRGLLIQEWVQGMSLLDLLRRRRGLPVADVFRIVATLPETLDFLAREAIPPPRPLLGKLFVQWDNPPGSDTVTATPVEQWPPFTLKLNALNIREWVATPSIDDTAHTVIVDPHEASEISDRYGPREFARLLYELLGGRIRELDARRYSPIGALGEGGNAVLRRTLFAMPHPNCTALWEDLLETQPGFLRRPSPVVADPLQAQRPLRIPEALLPCAHPAKVLQLDPMERSGTPIRLVARTRFNIGRSPAQADFVARILPENEVNDVLTNRLSRIHAYLERQGDALLARDGNGNGSSLNGSLLNGERLVPDPPSPLTDRSLLWLGDEYALELIPVYENALRCPAIGNLEAWAGVKEDVPEDGPCGALICLPTNGYPVVQHAAWLFTEAGFGLDGAEHLAWDVRGRSTSPAAFHYHCGHFWLGNRSLPETALACGDTPLRRDEIAPLVPGQTVRMGSNIFTVRTE